jgi:UDP-N-acetylglucosamine--N-acetylmuramyl-(pentapeptide) pyrophosphoryl-undecaprenol N-acetylglucosamine transferase
MKKILFTGGGSAGHVVPNIALIEQLLSDGDVDVCYMGTNGIEKNLVTEWKIPYWQIECPKLIRGGGMSALKRNLAIPAAFLRAYKQAKQGLRTFRPDVVFSKGGYVALPVVFAAKRLKIPCFAHESDFSAGLANKISAPKCQCTFTSFPETAKTLRRGVHSGAPLRRTLFSATRAQARKEYGVGFSDNVLLVFGGGSGSEAINRAVRQHIKTLTEKYVVLHVCGKGNLVDCNIKNYRQFEFVADMGSAYACADVVLARAGAGTVFELLALKKPALLVPLEGQTRGDQWENAQYFQKKGLCRVLAQSNLSRLPAEIDATFADETLRQNLAAANYTGANAFILQELRRAIKK